MAIKKIIKKNNGIIGIDMSLNGTALIHLVDGQLENKWMITSKAKSILKKESFATLFDTKKINEFERLILIRDTVKNIINDIQPEYISIEDYALGATYSTINTGEVGGVLRVLIYESGIPMRFYEPTKVKKFCTGSGSAPKSAVGINVYKNWGYDFSMYNDAGEDLSDAFAIAKLLEFELQLRSGEIKIENQPKYIQEVFMGVSKSNPLPLIERKFIVKE